MKMTLLALLVLLANCSAGPLPNNTIRITTTEQSFAVSASGNPLAIFRERCNYIPLSTALPYRK